ncbi:LysR family transcriptional regulator [Paracoccus versutus]|uniref:LysR family transcriptional regulator n=1 Tax=Paracoccus versutus TaxID=34007 RepID=UPI000DF80094|nr:LysR family transcriptional regulator [Paracoccus versutus]RDD68623.1 LysR family transcriptional regulator [Paracoccus versutus]
MRSRLTLRQLRYVCEVARLQNVLAASRALGISTSSILAAIDAAEHEAGTRIFNRFPAKGIRITPAGSRFVAAAARLLAAETEFARATSDISARIPDPLRIGCFEPLGTLLLPSVLRRFTANEADVEIMVREGDQSELRDWLSAGEIEFAVLYEGDIIAPFDRTPICLVPPHVAMHPDDPLARQEAIRIADIARRPFVLLDQPEIAPQLLAIFRLIAEAPQISFRARTYGAALAAISEGFGLSILNLRPLTPIYAEQGAIVRKPIVDDLPFAKLVVADTYGAEKPYFLQSFIATFRKYLAEIGTDGFAVRNPGHKKDLLF